MKRFLIALAALVTLSSCTGTRRGPEGELISVDSLKVVSLQGSWEQMGKQYGKLAGPYLRHLYEVGIASKLNAENAAKATAIADSVFAHYPYKFKKFFESAAMTSGLTLAQLKLCNAIEYADWMMNCSALCVWDGHTPDGSLIYGRNYDAGAFHDLAQDILVTVFRPDDGSLPCAIVGYAGEIYCVNGINAAGIFIELNSGAPSAGFSQDYDGHMGTTSLLELLLQADTLGYVDAFFHTTRSSSAFIIGCADAFQARSYEWCAQGARLAPATEPGMMVMTNHYICPEWGFDIPADSVSWQSPTRRANLISLAREHKGSIDRKTMQEIMQLPISEGGALKKSTEYQIVATPEDFTLSIRIPGYCDWTELQLGKLIKRD